MKERLSRTTRNGLLLFGSLILCFAVLEVVFRIIAPEQPPGTTYGKPVVKNSDGFRDREFSVEKPEDTYRILVLGDSFTWGIGLDVDETIPKLLEQDLSEDGSVEVINAAVPGHNTVQQLMDLRQKGIRYEPDLVLLVYNLNDIEYLPELDSRQTQDIGAAVDMDTATPIVEIDPGESISDYSGKSGLRGLIRVMEKRSAFVEFLMPRVGALLVRADLITSIEFSWVAKTFQAFNDRNPGWQESKRALGEMAELSRENDAELMVALYPLLVELDNYRGTDAHRTVTSFCRARDIEVIDLLPVFENTSAQSHWINIMDGHPDAEAHRLVADRLLPVVRERIKEAGPR